MKNVIDGSGSILQGKAGALGFLKEAMGPYSGWTLVRLGGRDPMGPPPCANARCDKLLDFALRLPLEKGEVEGTAARRRVWPMYCSRECLNGAASVREVLIRRSGITFPTAREAMGNGTMATYFDLVHKARTKVKGQPHPAEVLPPCTGRVEIVPEEGKKEAPEPEPPTPPASSPPESLTPVVTEAAPPARDPEASTLPVPEYRVTGCQELDTTTLLIHRVQKVLELCPGAEAELSIRVSPTGVKSTLPVFVQKT